MARGQSLATIRQQLRAEIKHAVNPALGVDFQASLDQAIRLAYTTLHESYDWPHLRMWGSKTVAAGGRYYDLPTGMLVENLREIKQIESSNIYDIERGISFEEYAQWDSDADERSDFIDRWEIVSTAEGAEQIEVWPIPATNAGTLKIKGKRTRVALVDDEDLCDLDDFLVVLVAAADLLVEKKPKEAQAKANRATVLVGKALGNMSSGNQITSLGGGPPPPRRERLRAPRN